VRLAEALVVMLVLVPIIAAAAMFVGWDLSWEKWSRIENELTVRNTRLLAYGVCLKMIPDAGWWGYGPGTFQTAFPFYTHDLGGDIAGRWIYAHQDYLQTMIEWGYLGALAWGICIIGAGGAGCIVLFKNRHELPQHQWALQASMLVALLGVLAHSLVDFPLQVASIQLYVAVLAGMLWSSCYWLTPHPVHTPAGPTSDSAGIHDRNPAKPS